MTENSTPRDERREEPFAVGAPRQEGAGGPQSGPVPGGQTPPPNGGPWQGPGAPAGQVPDYPVPPRDKRRRVGTFSLSSRAVMFFPPPWTSTTRIPAMRRAATS